MTRQSKNHKETSEKVFKHKQNLKPSPSECAFSCFESAVDNTAFNQQIQSHNLMFNSMLFDCFHVKEI